MTISFAGTTGLAYHPSRFLPPTKHFSQCFLFHLDQQYLPKIFINCALRQLHFYFQPILRSNCFQIINGGNRHVNQPGILKKWQLIFYGTSVNPVRLRPPNGARSTPWKSPLNTYTFPTLSQPVTQVTDNFFEADNIFRNFQNFPNIYAFSGSDTDEAVSSLDGKNTKVRDNVNNDINNDRDLKDGCDVECDDQGCFGKGPSKCIACRNKRMDK